MTFKFLGKKPPFSHSEHELLTEQQEKWLYTRNNAEHFRGALLEAGEVIDDFVRLTWPEFSAQYPEYSSSETWLWEQWLLELVRVSAGEGD